MAWDRALNDLQAVLADLYPDEADARRVAEGAGLNTAFVDLGGSALDRWHSVLSEAARQGHVDDLIALAQGEYRVHASLARAVEAYRARPPRTGTAATVGRFSGRVPLLAALAGLVLIGVIAVVVATRALDWGSGQAPPVSSATPTDPPAVTPTVTETPAPTATVTPARPTPFPTVVYTAFQVFEPPDDYALQGEYRVRPGILPSETITDFLRLTSVEWGDLIAGGESAPAFRFVLTLKNTGDQPIALDLDERFYRLADTRGGVAELAYYCCAARGDLLRPGEMREIILVYRMLPGWFGSKSGPGRVTFSVQGLEPVLSATWELPLPKTAA